MNKDFPSIYPSLEFPFFENEDSDNHLDLLGREDVIQNINSLMHNCLDKDKYWPIIIVQVAAWGKQIKNHIQTNIIRHAITTGRILSFDFAKHPDDVRNENDVYRFFPRLSLSDISRHTG